MVLSPTCRHRLRRLLCHVGRAACRRGSGFSIDAASHRYENACYRLRFNPVSGGIKSIVDKPRAGN